MVDLSLQERLQPSLLDRLRDDHPDETKESLRERVLSLSELRQSVQRDIAWLLNACNLGDVVAPYPEVARSVLNYGIPDLAGLTVSTIELDALKRTIQQALETFEPRLRKHSIRLQARLDPQKMSHNTLVFDIECELWAYPAPVELLLRTELNLESGDVAVQDLTNRKP